MPAFHLGHFLLYSLDYLQTHPWAFGAVLATALLLIVECCLRIAHYAAQRTLQREARAAAVTDLERFKREIAERAANLKATAARMRDDSEVA